MCRNRSRHLPHGTTRRDVLRFTLGSVGLAALGSTFLRRLPAAYGAPQNLTRLVCINMVGGNDGLSTVVPRDHQATLDTKRPTVKVTSAEQLLMTGGPNGTTHYGFHPALDGIRALWDLGEVAVVNKVGYPQPNLSHFTSQDVYSLGVRGSFSALSIPQSGWIARYADAYAATPMGAVSVGMGRPLDFVGGTSNPFMASSLAAFNFTSDSQYAADAQHRLQVVQSVLAGYSGTGVSSQAKAALDLGQQLATQIQTAVSGYSTSVTFPNTSLGNFLKDVSILIQGGFETRVFYTGFGSFDTHSAQRTGTNSQDVQLGRVDDAVTAFVQDMKNRGQWNNTRIVIFSEFGRRTAENASNGTDHAEASCSFVLGGGIAGGMKGPDIVASDLTPADVPYAVDFRDVYRDVIENHLGSSAVPVLPEAQTFNTALGIA